MCHVLSSGHDSDLRQESSPLKPLEVTIVENSKPPLAHARPGCSAKWKSAALRDFNVSRSDPLRIHLTAVFMFYWMFTQALNMSHFHTIGHKRSKSLPSCKDSGNHGNLALCRTELVEAENWELSITDWHELLSHAQVSTDASNVRAPSSSDRSHDFSGQGNKSWCFGTSCHQFFFF